MDFIDLVQSAYHGQHKAIPTSITCVQEGKYVRIQKQANERKSRRTEAFDANRFTHNSAPSTPEVELEPPVVEKVDQRKKQLLLWKQERMRRKNTEPKKPPPFKAGVVKHALVPFQEPIFQIPPKKATNLESAVFQRVTRSVTRAKLIVQATTEAVKSRIMPEKSFAPVGAKFVPPKLNTKQVKPIKNETKGNGKSIGLSSVFAKSLSSLKQINTNKNKRAADSTTTKCKSTSKKIKIDPEYCAIQNNKSPNKDSPSKSLNSSIHKVTPDQTRVMFEVTPPVMKTPINKSILSNGSHEEMHTSPFITVARGKSSVRRETLCKIKIGFVSEMSPEKSAAHFRLQLDREIERLQGMCSSWRLYQKEHQQLTEDSNDLINLAIGQAQLLMSKKFEQFRGLIVKCENKQKCEGEGIVTVQDLQGFWDMIYMQVENIDVRFNKLKESRENNWVDIDAPIVINKSKTNATRKPKTTVKNPKSSIGLKAMIQAAREKTKKELDSKDAHQVCHIDTKQDNVTFNGGFFSVVSPAKTTPNKRPSLLRTVVDTEAQKRHSIQTPSTSAILRASQVGKCLTSDNAPPDNDEIKQNLTLIDWSKTPGKSILKTPGTKQQPKRNSRNRKSVKIYFGDEMEPLNIVEEKNTIQIDNDFDDSNVLKDNVAKTKRGRLVRQNAERMGSDENTPPSVTTNKQSNKGRKRTRRSTTPKKVSCIEKEELSDLNTTPPQKECTLFAGRTPRRSARKRAANM